jgi:hypothetical protein
MKSSVNEGSWREWDTGGKVGYRRSRVCGVVDSKPRCEDGEGGGLVTMNQNHMKSMLHAQLRNARHDQLIIAFGTRYSECTRLASFPAVLYPVAVQNTTITSSIKEFRHISLMIEVRQLPLYIRMDRPLPRPRFAPF